MAYDPNKNYVFKDENGNVMFTSKGDNQYVWQSMTEGIPIYVNDKGEWYTQPYLESTPTGVVLHNTDWFKNTDEYKTWNDTILPQLKTRTLSVDLFNQAQDLVKSLSNQGLLRYTTKNQSTDAGIVSPSHQDFVFNQYIAAINEGAKNGNANLVAYGDTTGKGESVADVARYYKNMSKEDLSRRLLEWERILDKDNTTDSQDEKANVLATYKILNLVADNPSDFGDGEEFKGLLEASEWQKFQTHINNVIQSISEGMPIVTFGSRLGSGLASGLKGEGFGTGWQIENRRDQQYGYLRDEATGGGLRGTEGSAVSGTVAGSVTNMAGTMAQSAVFGTWLNSTSLGSSVGTALKGGSSALSTLGGGMIYDFFANDLPVDLSLFAADVASTGSAQEAWESQTGQTQPLFGLFGPQVSAGLKYNLIGDAVLDLTLPVISIGNKAMYNKLDDITGGSVSKIRENVAVKNLAVQQKISDMPVVGTSLQKFSNWLFGAENASYIREKRKEAIIAGSMTPYIDAQNRLTLKNHYGAEVVAPLYAKKANDLNINSRIKDFQKNANRYGGMGEVKVEWDTAKGGVGRKITETVQDDLPRDVKQGLLDYQRLEELKGEKINEGELIANPKRDNQIATLEKKVADMPEEIKKFAEDFSTLNKQVEQIAVDLGLKPQDWLDALLQDPRWKNYMVRQVLLPGGIQKAGSYDPATNKLLTGKRTGYYDPSKTLSPVMALDMKVHALGNAYAWNERAKSLVAAELTQGKITSGGNSVELAQKIKEKKAELMAVDAANAKLGYDAITKGYNDRMYNLSESVRKINEKLQSVDNITAKSVYTTNNNLETKGIVADFNSGKITYGDGVLEGSGLSVQDGNAVINNTYIPKSREARKIEVADIADTSALAKFASDNDYPGFKINERADGNSGKLRMLDESDPNFTREGTRRDYYRDYKGRELRVIEMAPEEYGKLMGRDGRALSSAERETASYYTKKFNDGERVDIPYIDYGSDWKITGQEGRHRAVGAAEAGIEKIPVIIDYPKGAELPDFLKQYADVTDSFVIRPQDDTSADIAAPTKYAGITSNGVPYEYTIENNKVTSMKKVVTDQGYSEAVEGISGGRFSISTEQVAKIGHENAAGVNIAVMFYRDNMPVIKSGSSVKFDGKDRNYGHEPNVKNTSEWHWQRTSDGHIKIDEYPVYLGSPYRKGREKEMLAAKKKECTPDSITGIAQKPVNTANAQSTPVHEMGHSYMTQLAVAEINRKVDAGELVVPEGALGIGMLVERERCILGETFIKNTMENLGYDVSGIVPGQKWPDSFVRDVRKEARNGISGYAGDRVTYRGRLVREPSGNPYLGEVFSEGTRYYSGNGLDASPFAMNIINQMSAKGQQFSGVVNPKESLSANNLTAPKGLIKGDDYAFPASVKTQAQKAEWLDKWRQKNPYLKGELTEETFQKANLWDSYFQKEIRSYDGNSKSVAPDSLIKKSGDFVEKQRAQMAKDLTDEIKIMSGGEFDSDLAMIIMGRNGDDIAKAMDNYIIRQIDSSAEELAKNMDGGLTEDNLNIARITLWSDESTRESTKNMMMALVPDGGDVVTSKVDILFDTQAKGLASYDALPLDTKQLLAEKDALVEKLYKENGKVIKEGKKLDKNSSFIEGGTHVIHYKESGEDVYVTVDDPVIASILQKPYDYKEHGLIAESMQTAASFLATTYRLGTTGINPMAFIRNILRDPIQAMVTGGFNPLNMSLSPEVFYKTLRQYGLDDDTILQVTDRIRNWAASSTMTAEMRLGPGKNSKTYRNEVQKLNNKLRDVTNGKIITALQTPLESWEGFFRNQIGQQSFMKNFERTGDVDKALSSALFDTSNVTTNFSHAIGKFKNVTATIPYLSSAINGTVSFWRLFNIDPMGMTARITAGFMLPVMAITAWNLSSEENRRAYEALPEWFKQGHIVLTDPSGNIIAFPLPEEIQQFAGTARKLIEYTNDVSPYSLATIAAQGAFGFLPFEVEGFWGDDGSFQLKEGAFQMVSGLIPQAATTLYELIWQQDLYTGQDLSTYNGINTAINTLGNIFGTGIIQAFNSIGIMAGASESDLIGKSFQNTIARDLFGQGFDAAKNQFMSIVGKPAQLQQDGKMSQPTGLFKENEDLKKKIDALNTKIAVSSDSDKVTLEEEKQKLINEFTDKVKNAMDKYQRMFSLTGGLEQWQKNRLVQLLTLGDAWSSGEYTSYQSEAASEAYLNERGLAMQRYVQAGLPAGPDLSNLASGSNSIEIQAALNRFYGGPKQAATDYRNAVENAGLKDIRNEFYNAISQIYDSAEAQNKKPDYDMIEKIQARYLQAVDSVLIPIINQYGINILNNADFIDAVRKQVNGMIPSDDWRQSVRNAKKFLSSKDFPTTTVDVKKWLIQRYSSGMRNRNINSDQEVTNRLAEIKADIDAGRRGNAQGKIKSLMDGVNKANFYISSTDLQTLTQYNNMLK